MTVRWLKILILLLLVPFVKVSASHIVGGEVTYRYLGPSGTSSSRYEITLVIYEDCKNGQPDAIQQDNPAFLSVFSLTPGIPRIILDTTIFFSSSVNVPANFTNACVSNIPEVCLLKKTFIRQYTLTNNDSGYIISYQRCCRNGQIANIVDPGNQGATYFCVIPPRRLATTNSSAVFNNFPPQIICVNNPLYYDNSATDIDGDSLTYEFCTASEGVFEDPGGGTNVKPYPGPPPYPDAQYINPPYSASMPFTGFPPIQIDPNTGIITGTPNRIGRYLVTVCCHEWRNGVLINTTKREFQFVVTDCSKVVVASIPQYSTDVNTYIVECDSFNVKFVNNSKGGFSYHWDFGVPGITSDTSNEFQPSYTYSDTGVFTVKLVVNPGSTCPDSISRFVKVFPKFHSDFSDSGLQCPGLPIYFKDQSQATIKPIISWTWNFGDGYFSNIQDPVHIYSTGGTYNVLLVSQNIKNCIDTIVHQVVIETFKPNAGKDTVIVKGESIFFNATGGTSYLWSPTTYLSDPTIPNPIGIYPDTGVINYVVAVKSAYGCEGNDTIKVWVVNQAAFFMPTAFTPNGDGLNDVFRPVVVGYRSIRSFRIYNRWGQVVYFSDNINDGWDGTYNHKLADMGTYYWQLNYTDRFGKEAYLKGDMTLIR